LKLRELEAQAKALAPVLRGFVERALGVFRDDLAKDAAERDQALRKEFAEGLEKVKPLDVQEVAQEVAKLIPAPQDGRSVDMDEVAGMVADAVKAEIVAMPAPKDGQSVTLDDVAPMIQEQVQQAVAALPPDEAGASVTAEELRPLIADEVAKLPPPKDGDSVTVEDVAPMIQEQVQKAVAALPPAEPGASVTAEDLRPLIAQELAKALEGLELPKDGEPGRDALQLEILPEIDASKSFVRGTFAKHAGGLWRAFERTHGMKGWECIVEGLAGVEVEQSGERGLDVALTLSSGAQVRKALALPVMIYRGVFTPGDYTPGDTVTWGGSLWHCDEATADKPGELGSKGWTLAAKRGRDGKPGTNGRDLTKGVAAL